LPPNQGLAIAREFDIKEENLGAQMLRQRVRCSTSNAASV
jgi:hypothetical protein